MSSKEDFPTSAGLAESSLNATLDGPLSDTYNKGYHSGGLAVSSCYGDGDKGIYSDISGKADSSFTAKEPSINNDADSLQYNKRRGSSLVQDEGIIFNSK